MKKTLRILCLFDQLGRYHEFTLQELARYPELSDRTRQRDFRELAAAGCGVRYVSAADSPDGEKGYWKYDCYE